MSSSLALHFCMVAVAMVRLTRAEVVDPAQVEIFHVISRTVRRCFLMGHDKLTGKNYDHRKQWIEDRLQHFAAHFGIELLCYSILSNHSHLVLKSRPDVVATWNDTEVARRWLMICPKRKKGNQPAEPNESELNSIRNCPKRLTEIRERLSSISWWMRLLNQHIACRANREEEEQGRFWQDRFRSIRITDEPSLLACAAYVELNPIRAAMAETIEESDHTSVQRRIESEKQAKEDGLPAAARRDAFLAKLTCDEANDPTGPVPSATKQRCSDKGFLAIEPSEYFELLDWSARQIVRGKKGYTPKETPPVLQRLGLSGSAWHELIESFEQSFYHVAGRADMIESLRSHITKRRFYVRPKGRRLMATAA